MALPKMTKPQLIADLAELTGIPQKDARALVEALDAVVIENLSRCIRTQVAGVTIEPKLRAATKKRMGRNPATGEEVQIAAKPASVRVAARVSKPLKESVPSVRQLHAAL